MGTTIGNVPTPQGNYPFSTAFVLRPPLCAPATQAPEDRLTELIRFCHSQSAAAVLVHFDNEASFSVEILGVNVRFVKQYGLTFDEIVTRGFPEHLFDHESLSLMMGTLCQAAYNPNEREVAATFKVRIRNAKDQLIDSVCQSLLFYDVNGIVEHTILTLVGTSFGERPCPFHALSFPHGQILLSCCTSGTPVVSAEEQRPKNPERYKAENLYRTPSPASENYGRIFPEPETRTYHPAELGGYGNLRPPTHTIHHPASSLSEEDPLRVLTSACPQPESPSLGARSLASAEHQGSRLSSTGFTVMESVPPTPSEVAARALSVAQITSSLREHESLSVDDD